jgi:arylsulfatase
MPATRRQFLASAALPAFSQSRRPPNIVIVLSDDQGYGDLSCHGNPYLKTPNLDKLHSESVRFTDFHSAPMCTPTRGELLTGMDALRNRATSVTAGRAVVQRDIPLMSNIFGAAGYSTGLFGKWHIGDCYPYRPMDRGFQTAKYHLGWGLSSAPEFDNDYQNGRYRDQGVEKQFDGYCTDFWFREAMSWMKQQKNPFLCYLPTNTPHGPQWVDPKYSAPYRKPGLPADFYGMIANLDENMGKLDAFLASAGLRDNTIVMFLTDNGGTGGVNAYNAGLRARKTQIYDGGHRVPCFIRWPGGGFRPAADVATPAQMQDVLPTLMELCGVKKPANATFDGASLAPLLRGKSEIADRMMVVQYGQILKKWDACTIWGKWRLVKDNELYDIVADRAQQNNIAAQHPDVLKKMRDHYEAWWAKLEPTLGDYCPISIGAPQENPTYLTSSDWQDIYVDNYRTVCAGEGGPQGAPWNLAVERDGDYEIALARWPVERRIPLTDAVPARQMAFGKLDGGKAFPIAAAKLRIAGQELAAKAKPGDSAVLFRVKLRKAAKIQMQGWFQDAAGADLCGSFYARVKRV